MMPRPESARDITRAPSPGSYRSRTIERPQVTAAAIAAPCSARQTISASMLGAAAPNTLAIVYSARPPSNTGRRPKRSASGPQTSCARPKQMISADNVSCAAAIEAPRLAWTVGNAGR